MKKAKKEPKKKGKPVEIESEEDASTESPDKSKSPISAKEEKKSSVYTGNISLNQPDPPSESVKEEAEHATSINNAIPAPPNNDEALNTLKNQFTQLQASNEKEKNMLLQKCENYDLQLAQYKKDIENYQNLIANDKTKIKIDIEAINSKIQSQANMSEGIEKSINNCTNLKAEIEKANNSYSSLSDHIINFQSQLQSQQKVLDQFKSVNQNTQYDQFNSKIGELKQIIQANQNQKEQYLENCNKKLESKTSEIASLNSTLNELQNSKATLNEQLNSSNKKIEELDMQLKASNEAIALNTQKFTALESQLHQSQASLSLKDEATKGIQLQLQASEADLKLLQSKYNDEVTRNTNKLVQSNSDTEVALINANKSIEVMKSEISKLSDEKNALIKNVGEKDQLVKDTDSKYKESELQLESKLSTKTKDLDDLSNKMTELKNILEANKLQIESLNKEKDDLILSKNNLNELIAKDKQTYVQEINAIKVKQSQEIEILNSKFDNEKKELNATYNSLLESNKVSTNELNAQHLQSSTILENKIKELTNEVNQFKELNTKLSDSSNKLNEENQILSKEINNTKNQTEMANENYKNLNLDKEKIIQKLQNDNEKLTQQITLNNDQLTNQLQSKLKENETHITDLNNKINALEKSNQEITAQFNNEKNLKDQYNNENAQLKIKVDQYIVSLQEIETKLLKSKEETNAEVTALNNALNELKNSKASLIEQLNNANKKSEELDSQLKASNESIALNSQKLSTLESQLHLNQSSAGTKDEVLKGVMQQLQKSEADFKALQLKYNDDVALHTEKLSTLKSEADLAIANANKSIESLKSEINLLSDAKNATTKTIEEKDQLIKTHESKQKEIEQQFASKLANHVKEIENCNTEITNLTNKQNLAIRSYESQLNDVKLQLNNKLSEISNLTAEREIDKATLAQINSNKQQNDISLSDLQKYKDQNVLLLKKNEDTIALIKELETAVFNKNAEIQQMKSTIALKSEEIEKAKSSSANNVIENIKSVIITAQNDEINQSVSLKAIQSLLNIEVNKIEKPKESAWQCKLYSTTKENIYIIDPLTLQYSSISIGKIKYSLQIQIISFKEGCCIFDADNQFWKIDTNGVIFSLPAFDNNAERTNFKALEAGNHIYVVAGTIKENYNIETSKYNFKTNKWEQIAALNTGCILPASFSNNIHIYVCGGVTTSGPIQRIERYNHKSMPMKWEAIKIDTKLIWNESYFLQGTAIRNNEILLFGVSGKYVIGNSDDKSNIFINVQKSEKCLKEIFSYHNGISSGTNEYFVSTKGNICYYSTESQQWALIKTENWKK